MHRSVGIDVGGHPYRSEAFPDVRIERLVTVEDSEVHRLFKTREELIHVGTRNPSKRFPALIASKPRNLLSEHVCARDRILSDLPNLLQREQDPEHCRL